MSDETEEIDWAQFHWHAGFLDDLTEIARYINGRDGAALLARQRRRRSK